MGSAEYREDVLAAAGGKRELQTEFEKMGESGTSNEPWEEKRRFNIFRRINGAEKVQGGTIIDIPISSSQC